MILRLTMALAVAVGLIVVPAWAADHRDLEENLPVRVEDAYPHAFRTREFQTGVRWQRESGQDVFELLAAVDYGAARNLQVSLGAEAAYASGEFLSGSGDVFVHGLYNFKTETLRAPAWSLAVDADFPTGKQSEGTDITVKGIMTKTLGSWARRVHVNVAYTDVGSPQPSEKSDRWFVGLAWDRPLGFDQILVIDAYWEEADLSGREDAVVAEAGIRRQLTPWQVLGYGLSAGLSDGAPDVGVTLAYHHSF